MTLEKPQRFCLIKKLQPESTALLINLSALFTGKSPQLTLVSRQRSFLQTYLLIMSLKVLLLDLILYRDQTLLLALWIRHLLLLFLFLIAFLLARLNLPSLANLPTYNAYAEICIGILGLVGVVLWTQVYLKFARLVPAQSVGINYGVQLMAFCFLVLGKIQRNSVKGIFVLILTSYVSVRCTLRVSTFQYGEFIEFVLFGVMLLGVACGNRREGRGFGCSGSCSSSCSGSLSCGSYSTNCGYGEMAEEKDDMTMVPVEFKGVSAKSIREVKIQSKRELAKAQEMNKRLFLRVLTQSLDHGLLLTDCEFTPLYSNDWLTLKYSSDMFSSLSVITGQSQQPLKKHLLDSDIYNINSLFIPRVICKVLGCVQLKITKHNIDENRVLLFEVRRNLESEEKSQPDAGNSLAVGLERARTITKQELEEEGQNQSQADSTRIYELMMDRDIINLEVLQPIQTPAYLISLVKLHSQLTTLFSPYKSSVTITLNLTSTQSQYLYGNYQLFKYVISCIHRITRPQLPSFDIVIEKNTIKIPFVKCDALYKKFLAQLTEPCCDQFVVSERAVEIRMAEDEVGRLYSEVDGKLMGALQEVSQFVNAPTGTLELVDRRVLMLGVDAIVVGDRLARAGFTNVDELVLDETSVIDPEAIVVTDARWIFDNARNPLVRKVRNRMVVVVQGYYSDNDIAQIQFVGGKHFPVPIYCLKNELGHLAHATVY